MNRPKRRHKTGFSYIGAGNNKSVFNKKPTKAFSKAKEKLNSSSLKGYKLEFTNCKLTEAEREHIKNDIRSKSVRKNKLTLLLSILIMIPIILVIIALIEGVLSKYR
ncbi:hypothetical protein [uncultured Lacinutrix sp.]|uniref:hypothetical protein n=1 Tax=uncultured Lacinutrix sp. TaxID=574032 RepID=UPI002638995A|nr:hypothetical protein [uncultured Lacinutrix sp.]